MEQLQLLRLPVAAHLLDVHPRTLERWAADGKIVLVRLPGRRGQYRITQAELDRLMQASDKTPAEPKP